MNRFRFLLLLLALVIPASGGVDSSPRRLGLTVSLTTSSYRVAQPSAESRPAPFVAAVALTNYGRDAVPFSFPDAAAAQRRFVFRLSDAAGTQLWESEPSASATDLAPLSVPLAPGKSWRRTVQVPLVIGGQALAAGRYTLEATVADGGGGVGASTRFEVTSPWSGLDPLTGIEGTVVRGPGALPAPGTTISITELRATSRSARQPRFVATTHTDEQGSFRVVAPPGHYRVTAGETGGLTLQPVITLLGSAQPVPLITSDSAAVDVVVSAGAFAHVSLTLPAPSLPAGFDSPPYGFSMNLWEDYASDDIVVEVIATVSSGGYTTQLLPLGTSPDGVARLAFGMRRPTGSATQAFETLRTVRKIARTPGLHRVEVNGMSSELSALIAVDPLSPDTGIDVITVQSIGGVDVPFADQQVKVAPSRNVQQSFTIGPDGQAQAVPPPTPFLWEGRSDANGRVSIDAPPGLRFVTLTWGENPSAGASYSYYASVIVTAGQRTVVTLRKEPGGYVSAP